MWGRGVGHGLQSSPESLLTGPVLPVPRLRSVSVAFTGQGALPGAPNTAPHSRLALPRPIGGALGVSLTDRLCSERGNHPRSPEPPDSQFGGGQVRCRGNSEPRQLTQTLHARHTVTTGTTRTQAPLRHAWWGRPYPASMRWAASTGAASGGAVRVAECGRHPAGVGGQGRWAGRALLPSGCGTRLLALRGGGAKGLGCAVLPV